MAGSSKGDLMVAIAVYMAMGDLSCEPFCHV